MSKKKSASAASTPATTVLDRAAVNYSLHPYTHDKAAESFGLEAAEALGVAQERVFKTLLVATGASGAGALAVGIVPVNRQLDLKAMANALGVKKVEMADPAAAERRTGYVLGGISPLGQRNPSRTVLDASALDFATVFVSGGHRGLDIELAPRYLQRLTAALIAPIGH